MKLVEDFEHVEQTEGRYVFDYAQQQFRWKGPAKKRPMKIEAEDESEDD